MGLVALVGSAACGAPTDTVAPVRPGAMVLTVETSGFFQDDSYELLVDGLSQGTVGANDEVMFDALDPATYQVALTDVAENCSVDGVSVAVASDQTASATLSVVCESPSTARYTLRFGRARPDLDTGDITECPFSICTTTEAWDLYVYYNSTTIPHSVIRQNQTNAVGIAHVSGYTLATLTPEHVAGATFTTDLVATPFDAFRVILIRTDLGYVYALGNPSEDTTAQTLTFDAVLVAGP